MNATARGKREDVGAIHYLCALYRDAKPLPPGWLVVCCLFLVACCGWGGASRLRWSGTIWGCGVEKSLKNHCLAVKGSSPARRQLRQSAGRYGNSNSATTGAWSDSGNLVSSRNAPDSSGKVSLWISAP